MKTNISERINEPKSCAEIASDYNLWSTYVDPDTIMSRSDFEDTSAIEKIDTLHYMFPGECNCT